jgi:SAM-dependent methyltransferase
MHSDLQTRTKRAYGLQWNRYRIIRPEEDRVTFFNRTGLTDSDLNSQVVLDAGCGMGRYLRIAAETRARLIIGLDLSEAVLAARELTREWGQVAVVRGDLLQPPFAPETFDHIYSLGVIDHTPDPRVTFLRLAKLLKPGGRIVVWVYPRERGVVEWIMNLQRAISTRLPIGILGVLCRLSAPVGGLKRRLMSSQYWITQRAGVALHLATIGVSMHPDAEVRACDTLDWYAPRHLSRHSFNEISGWFTDAGLVDVTDLSHSQVFYHEGQGRGINVAGRRPAPDDKHRAGNSVKCAAGDFPE